MKKLLYIAIFASPTAMLLSLDKKSTVPAAPSVAVEPASGSASSSAHPEVFESIPPGHTEEEFSRLQEDIRNLREENTALKSAPAPAQRPVVVSSYAPQQRSCYGPNCGTQRRGIFGWRR